MALLTSAVWSSLTGRSLTGADATSLGLLVDAVNAAAVRLMNGNVLEGPATYTEYYDAPLSEILTLRQGPVRSLTSINLATNARGDATLFDSTNLLVANTDYLLDVDRSDGFAWARRVRYLRGPVWAYWMSRPLGALTGVPRPAPLAVKVVYSAGIAVPADLQMALAWAVTQLLSQRRDGMPTTSESWNGESVSFASQMTASSALLTPVVFDVLRQYYARTLNIA